MSKSSTSSNFLFTAAALTIGAFAIGGVIYSIIELIDNADDDTPDLFAGLNEDEFSREKIIKYFDESLPNYKNIRHVMFYTKADILKDQNEYTFANTEEKISKRGIYTQLYKQLDDIYSKIEQLRTLDKLMQIKYQWNGLDALIEKEEQEGQKDSLVVEHLQEKLKEKLPKNVKEENKLMIKDFIIPPHDLISDLLSKDNSLFEHRYIYLENVWKDLLDQELNNTQWISKEQCSLKATMEGLQLFKRIFERNFDISKGLPFITDYYTKFEQLNILTGGIYIDREQLYSGGYNNPEDKIYEIICLGGDHYHYTSDDHVSGIFS